MQNCLQFDIMIVILEKRVKYRRISEAEHDFTIVVQHILHEGPDISISCFFSLTP